MAKTKSLKALPSLLGVKFKNQTGEHTGEILEDRGLFWKVRDEAGEEYQVKKTSCEPFELEACVAPPSELSASIAGLINAASKEPASATAKPKSEEKDPDIVTLAELCAEFKIVGRIARRRLRAAFGQVGTGSRWEWKKNDPSLAKVRSALAPAPAPTPEEPASEEPTGTEE